MSGALPALADKCNVPQRVSSFNRLLQSVLEEQPKNNQVQEEFPDVLTQLHILEQRDRQDFAQYISELRSYEPKILGLPVYERVYFEYVRSGGDILATKHARVPLSDFQDVFDFYRNDVAAIDPAGPSTVYVAHPNAMGLRTNALALKDRFQKRLSDAVKKGWVSYEEYIDMGAEGAFLSTLGVTDKKIAHYLQKNPKGKTPERIKKQALEQVEVNSFSRGKFNYLEYFQDNIFNSQQPVFPENIFVFVKAHSEEGISAEDIITPGTHLFLGEVTFDIKNAHGDIFFPYGHLKHDLLHARSIVQLGTYVGSGKQVKRRREDFKGWIGFRELFLSLRKNDPELYSFFIEHTSYGQFHERNITPTSYYRLYVRLKVLNKAKPNIQLSRALQFLMNKVTLAQWLSEKQFHPVKCVVCENFSSVQKAQGLKTHGSRFREMPADVHSMSLAMSDLKNDIGKESYYQLNFLDPIEKAFPQATWGDLEDIATGKIKVANYNLPERLALKRFLVDIHLKEESFLYEEAK